MIGNDHTYDNFLSQLFDYEYGETVPFVRWGFTETPFVNFCVSNIFDFAKLPAEYFDHFQIWHRPSNANLWRCLCCQFKGAVEQMIEFSMILNVMALMWRFQAGTSSVIKRSTFYPSGPFSLLCRHNGRDGVSNHQSHDCLLNRSFRRRSKKTLKLRVTGLSAGNSPVTGEYPAQMASNVENASIWWRQHVLTWSDYIEYKGWDEIACPLPNFSGGTG